MNKNSRSHTFARRAIPVLVSLLGLGAALPAAAQSTIASVVVRYQDAVVAPDAGAPPAQQLPVLSQALGVGYRITGRTRDGAFQLVLDTPLPIDAARAALNRIRLDSAVLYANAAASAATDVTPNRTGGIAATATVTAAPGLPTDRLIVRYRSATMAQATGARSEAPLQTAEVSRLSTLGGQPMAWVRNSQDGGHVLQMMRRLPASQVAAVAAALAQQPDIDYAEADNIWTTQLAPTDPCYASAGNASCSSGYQWDLFDPVGGINMPAAWDLTTGSAAIKVAIVDTGALFNHTDLSGRFLPGYDMISDALVANDGDVRDADASDPGDWITSAENTAGYFAGCGVRNSSWHGSHVAGTIGAIPNNSNGIAGINWVSGIVPVRVLGKCGGYTSDINDGIVWAAGGTVAGAPANANPVRVINISLGGSGTCPVSTQAAVNTALGLGAVIAVAAGNSNLNAANFSPASCNGVITVAATTRTGSRATYSNYGTSVEIAAPGGDAATAAGNILSTINSGTQSPAPTGWIYATYAGTSMATPHVTGVASLVLSRNPSLTPAQVLAKLQSTARAFPAGSTCNTSTCGAGILDAGKAVASATSAPTTTALASSVNPSTYGQSVTFTATVTGSSPTGTMAFKDGTTTLTGCGAVAVSSGTAQCGAATLAVGTHSVTAVYSGDTNNSGSTSPALSQSVAKATTTTALKSSANPTKARSNVTYTATVTGNAPTGTVAFTDGSKSISGCTAVNLTGTGNAKTATCTTKPTTTGAHAVAGAYKGDTRNATSSGTMTVTVN